MKRQIHALPAKSPPSFEEAALARLETALERLASIDGSLRAIALALASIDSRLAGLVKGRSR